MGGARESANASEELFMHWLKLPAEALSRIGRHGTLVAAASVFIGLIAPPLAAVLKPYLGPVIVAMLTLAFLRVDPAELRAYWVQPKLIAAATVWLMLLAPALLGLVFVATGLPHVSTGLYFMLVLQMAAPGLMSAPAIAALLGLDVALTLASLIVSTCLAPFAAALFTHVFLGTALISPLGLAFKLLLLIAGCAAGAALVRRFLGREVLQREYERIDGLSVICMLVFAIAAMDGVTAHAVADPALVAGITVLTFAIALGMMGITALLFLPAGRARAFAIALLAGNRNMGLMLTAIGFAVPDVAWLYFALGQLPIYLLPHLLRPLARRMAPPSGDPALQRPPAAC
jgi:BASS family bile acid:Na+ symporter